MVVDWSRFDLNINYIVLLFLFWVFGCCSECRYRSFGAESGVMERTRRSILMRQHTRAITPTF